MELDERIGAFCSSPAGCTFLLVVEESDLPPELAADPVVAMHAAAIALNEIDRWKVDHEQVVALALDEGPRLKDLARKILVQPVMDRWFGPVDRMSQWAILPPGEEVSPTDLVTPISPPNSWEFAAQKPELAEYSSTAVRGTCSVLAAMEHLAGDYYPAPSIGRVQLRASLNARVFEVDGPTAWHWLATSYPVFDEEGRLVPDWSGVAGDWDAVHLSLGGLLTAEQVLVVGPAGWSQHQA